MVTDPSSGGEGNLKKEDKRVSFAGWLANLAKSKRVGKFLVPAHITELPCGCVKPKDFATILSEGKLKSKFSILRALREQINYRPLAVVRCWHEHPFHCAVCGKNLQ